MLKKLSIIIFMILFLIGNSLYGGNEKDNNKTCKDLIKEYDEMLKHHKTSCLKIEQELNQLVDYYYKAFYKIILLNKLIFENRKKIINISQPVLIIKAQHEQLLSDAATKGLILKATQLKKIELVRKYNNNERLLVKKGIVGKNETVMFGIPSSAMLFEEKDIALLNAYREKERELYEKYQTMRKRATAKLKSLIPKINKQIDSQLKVIIYYIKKFYSLKQKIILELTDNKYPQCLGYYAGLITLPAGNIYNLKYIKVKGDPEGTLPEEIPGLNFKLPSSKELKAKIQHFKFIEFPDLKEPNFKKDGRFYAKQWAGVKRARLVSDEMDLIINSIEVVKAPLKSFKELSEAVFIDFPKGMADFVYEGYKTTLQFGYGIGTVLRGDKDVGFELIKDSIKKGFDLVTAPFQYYYHKGKDIYNNVIKAGEHFPTISKLPSYQQAKNIFTSYQNAISNLSLHVFLNADPINDPKYPEGGKTEDYLKYIKDADKRIEDVKNAAKFIDNFAKYTRARTKIVADMLELYITHAAPKELAKLKIIKNIKKAKEFASKYKTGSKFYAVNEKLLNAKKKVGKSLGKLVEISAEKKANLEIKVKEKYQKIKTKTGEKIAALKQNVKEKVTNIKEKVKGKFENLKNKAGESIEKIKNKFKKKNADRPLELVELKNKNPNKFIKKLENIIKKENFFKEGSVKKVYTVKGKKEVIQVLKESRKPKKIIINKNGKKVVLKELTPFEREKLGFKRLEEAGVKHVKVSEPIEVVVNGEKKIIRIAEKINSKNIAENIIKNNEWTPEHTRAIAEALKKLNEKGYIASDINTGNIYFERNLKTGKLEAYFLEGDGIISFKELKNTKIEITPDKIFDLSTKEGREGFQKFLMVEYKGGSFKSLINKVFAGELTKKLASEKYFALNERNEMVVPVGPPGEYSAVIGSLEKLNKIWDSIKVKVEESISEKKIKKEIKPVQKKLELVELKEKNPEVFKEKVKDFINSEKIGEGAYKDVYTKKGSKEVVQVIRKVKEPRFIEVEKNGKKIKIKEISEFEREKIGFERLDDAGVPHVKVSDPIEIVINGKKKLIRIAEKIDINNLARNIRKNGKWTPEHTKALAEALRKLNEKGYIAADINPGNIYFERNPITGKLEAYFLEADSIISYKDLKNKVITLLKNGRDVKFDLSTLKGREKLQKMIAAEFDGVESSQVISSELGIKLASEKLFILDENNIMMVPTNYVGVYVGGKYFTKKEFYSAWNEVKASKGGKTNVIVKKLLDTYDTLEELGSKLKTASLNAYDSIAEQINDIKNGKVFDSIKEMKESLKSKYSAFLSKHMKRKNIIKESEKLLSEEELTLDDIFFQSSEQAGVLDLAGIEINLE